MKITENIAEQFLQDNDSVDLKPYTSKDDAAAESLSTHDGDIYLVSHLPLIFSLRFRGLL